MPAYFIVRAKVPDDDVRSQFDRWYQDEHLPDALEAFNALRAWRGWSAMEPQIHYAYYEFADLKTARSILDSDAIKGLIAEFDRLWGSTVTRTREIVDCIQAIER